mgnify:CR=1 FL=1
MSGAFATRHGLRAAFCTAGWTRAVAIFDERLTG